MARRRLPARWPILPITGHSLEHVIYRLAEEQWRSAPGGPLPVFEVENAGLLRSALVQPYQVIGGRTLYPGVVSKAACLFRGLVKNHGLTDGNKRLGVTATGVFLLVNGYELTATPGELRDYALEVAGTSGNYPVRRIEQWLRKRTRLIPPDALARQRQANREVMAKVKGDLGMTLTELMVVSDGGFMPGVTD